jgi:hypothetical protein
LLDRFTPVDLTLAREAGDEFTMAVRSAFINASDHLVSDKGDKCVSLVVDLIKCVFPESVQSRRIDKKSTDCHPEAVGKRCEGKGDDENGEYGRN